MISPQKSKLIHVARRELELPEKAYREILRHHGGVESSKDLDEPTDGQEQSSPDQFLIGNFDERRLRGLFLEPYQRAKNGVRGG